MCRACDLLQDYETALSTLRLLCSDLKTDKKWRQYASAQVHTPVCILCTTHDTQQLVTRLDQFCLAEGVCMRCRDKKCHIHQCCASAEGKVLFDLGCSPFGSSTRTYAESLISEEVLCTGDNGTCHDHDQCPEL